MNENAKIKDLLPSLKYKSRMKNRNTEESSRYLYDKNDIYVK